MPQMRWLLHIAAFGGVVRAAVGKLSFNQESNNLDWSIKSDSRMNWIVSPSIFGQYRVVAIVGSIAMIDPIKKDFL